MFYIRTYAADATVAEGTGLEGCVVFPALVPSDFSHDHIFVYAKRVLWVGVESVVNKLVCWFID